jgi:hypothetical protein
LTRFILIHFSEISSSTAYKEGGIEVTSSGLTIAGKSPIIQLEELKKNDTNAQEIGDLVFLSLF